MNIKKTALQILEGWRNHLTPKEELKDMIEIVAAERMTVCNSCPHFMKNKIGMNYCNQCGCAFPAKAKCLSCHCPIHKWEAFTSDDERFEIEKSIKD